jgi:outer membrane protein assembly factor BamB
MKLARLTCAVLLAMASAAAAEDWPQWRGPTGQGLASEQAAPRSWSETENVTWKTPIRGKGWSSPVMLGNEIWLTTAEEKPDTPENIQRRLKANTGNQPLNLIGEATFLAVCIDKQSGKLLREVPLFTAREPQWVHRMNSYASPTPVIEPGRLYCHFGAEGTVCLDTRNARVLWINRDHKIMHENGPGSSPVLEGDRLIFHCDGSDQQFVVALDKKTGETAWKTPRSGTMDSNPQLKKAYGTPLVVPMGDRRVLMSPGPNWLYGYNPATGSELFKVPFGKLGFSIVPRPVAAHGMLYFSTSFMQAELLAVRYESGKPEIVWRELRGAPRTPSPLVAGNRLYMVSDEGGIVTCLDAHSGKLIYRERIQGSHWASPLYAAGHVYFFDRDGMTTVIAPGDKLQLVARNKLDGTIMASPAAVDGALFIRTEHALYRIEEQQPVAGR